MSKKGSIDWDEIGSLGATQAQGAAAVAAARPVYIPPPTTASSGGLQLNLVSAIAGAALGYTIARAADWPPYAGAAAGALLGGVLLG